MIRRSHIAGVSAGYEAIAILSMRTRRVLGGLWCRGVARGELRVVEGRDRNGGGSGRSEGKSRNYALSVSSGGVVVSVLMCGAQSFAKGRVFETRHYAERGTRREKAERC